MTATTPVGNGPDAIAVGEGAVWVADRRDGAVVRIDPATNSVTTMIQVGRGPTGIATGLGSVWVANSRDGTVSRIDPVRRQVVQTIRVGGSPQAIAVGNGRVWVSVQTALFDPAVRSDVLRVLSIGIDSLDPAIGYTFDAWAIAYVTCANLLNYPDRPAPTGSRLVPEVAAAMPVRSADGKSYTFTIRPGFRFSPPSNAPVTAQTFKFSIERALSPKIPDAPGRSFAADIVGVKAYEAGKAEHISGISVQGNTLTVRLTGASPDIVSRLAQPLFSRPARHPIKAAGMNTVSSAGPYYVAAYRPQQGAVLKRNPNYHGSRPHAFEEIDYEASIGTAQAAREIEAGISDAADVSEDVPNEKLASLAARYGPGSPAARAGKQRFFVNPLLGFVYLALNTNRPLFANADLRKAVNYALDRRAIAGPSGQPTDQYLAPGVPGFRDTHVYPLTPDLAQAKRLARGHGGRAVLYAGVEAGPRQIAQLIKAELASIGLDVQIKSFPSFAIDHIAGMRGKPFDMALDFVVSRLPRALEHPQLPLRRALDQSRRRTATCPTSTIRPTTTSSPPQHGSMARGATPPTRRSRPTSCETRRRQQRSTTCAGRVLLRPHRLPGLPARLPDRPCGAVPQAFSLTRQTSMRPATRRHRDHCIEGVAGDPACIGRTVVSVAGDRETPVDKPSATLLWSSRMLTNADWSDGWR